MFGLLELWKIDVSFRIFQKATCAEDDTNSGWFIVCFVRPQYKFKKTRSEIIIETTGL